MAPNSAAAMKKKISAGIAAFSYIKNDDGSPRWPAEPVIRARYIKHLIKWLPKQNKNFVWTLSHATFYSPRVVSSFEHFCKPPVANSSGQTQSED